MIRVTDAITLYDHDVKQRFVRSAGARGQNIRHKATAVELVVDLRRTLLPLEVQRRLIGLAGRRVTGNGLLTIVSRANRSQIQNRDAAWARLASLLKRAARAPKVSNGTNPPRSVPEERLAAKHRTGAIKRSRRFRGRG